MNIIKQFFSQEARDRRTLQTDNKRLALLNKMAEKAINVTYINTGIGNPEWGAPKEKEVFIIKLGKRIN